MELGSYFLFLQEQIIKDIVISRDFPRGPCQTQSVCLSDLVFVAQMCGSRAVYPLVTMGFHGSVHLILL